MFQLRRYLGPRLTKVDAGNANGESMDFQLEIDVVMHRGIEEHAFGGRAVWVMRGPG